VYEQPQEQRLGALIWRGKWIIAICLAVTVALALIVTSLSSKVYEASAIFQIKTPNANPGDATDLANQGLAKNYATLIVSPGFLDEARRKVEKGRFGTDELEGKLSAQAVEQTSLMELKARAGSPSEARQIASQVASAFVSSLQRDASSQARARQGEIDAEIQRQTARIDALQGQVGTVPGVQGQITALRGSRDALQRQSSNVAADSVAQGGSATLAAAPTASPSPVSPRPALNLIAALVLGLLVGIGIVVARSRLRPQLDSAESAARTLGVPVLSSIPLRRRPKAGDPVLTEAYEMLRAQLSLAAEGSNVRVLTIGSYNPGEGKTSVVEGTAYAAVRGGRNVLLIDADLRMGSLSKRLGLTEAPDLADVLERKASVDDAIRTLGPSLDVLPSVNTPSNPPALLNSSAMRQLIAEVEFRYDMVVIDSPPLAHLADASILASLSDGFVLVVRAGVSTPSDLDNSQTIVRRADSSILGIVVFETLSVDKTYYPSVATPYDLTGDAGASS
jgi:capsular exopolysaccharide synthesis family protein